MCRCLVEDADDAQVMRRPANNKKVRKSVRNVARKSEGDRLNQLWEVTKKSFLAKVKGRSKEMAGEVGE